MKFSHARFHEIPPKILKMIEARVLTRALRTLLYSFNTRKSTWREDWRNCNFM